MKMLKILKTLKIPWIFKILLTQNRRESLKYCLHRTLCNLPIFTNLVHSILNKLTTRAIWWTVFYRTLFNTDIFSHRGIFRTMLDIYYGEFYSEPCLTQTCLNPGIFRIQGIFIILSNICHEIFSLKPC